MVGGESRGKVGGEVESVGFYYKYICKVFSVLHTVDIPCFVNGRYQGNEIS